MLAVPSDEGHATPTPTRENQQPKTAPRPQCHLPHQKKGVTQNHNIHLTEPKDHNQQTHRRTISVFPGRESEEDCVAQRGQDGNLFDEVS